MIKKKFWVWVCFVFVILELGARVYQFSKIPVHDKPKGWQALLRLITAGTYVCEFPGGRYLFEKPEQTYRILAIGGSTTIGHKDVTLSWPYLLEKKLNALEGSAKCYEVINLGWWGADSSHEYYYLARHLYLKPDLVIVYDGYNDIVHANSTPVEYLLTAKKIYSMIEAPSIGEQMKFFLLKNLALANRLYIMSYRLTAKLNRMIARKKLFGVGSERTIRLFENVEWYRLHQRLWEEAEESPLLLLNEWAERKAEGKISAQTYERIRSLYNENGSTPKVDVLLQRIMALKVSESKKKYLMSALGLDVFQMKIAGLDIELPRFDSDDPGAKAKDMLQELYIHNLKNMASYLSANQVKGLFIFQPFLSEKDIRLKGALQENHYEWMPKNFNLSAYESFGRFSQGRKQMARQAIEANGLAFADAQPIFDSMDNRTVYDDMSHYTDLGAAIVADAISAQLKERGLLD